MISGRRPPRRLSARPPPSRRLRTPRLRSPPSVRLGASQGRLVASPASSELFVSGVTFIASVVVSVFLAGTRWGAVQAELEQLRRDNQTIARVSDLQALSERMAKVEGMFEMRLKNGQEMHRGL